MVRRAAESGFAAPGTCQPDARAFAAGQGVDNLVGEFFRVRECESFGNRLFVRLAAAPEQAAPGIASHIDEFGGGQRGGCGQVLWQISHVFGVIAAE